MWSWRRVCCNSAASTSTFLSYHHYTTMSLHNLVASKARGEQRVGLRLIPQKQERQARRGEDRGIKPGELRSGCAFAFCFASDLCCLTARIPLVAYCEGFALFLAFSSPL